MMGASKYIVKFGKDHTMKAGKFKLAKGHGIFVRGAPKTVANPELEFEVTQQELKVSSLYVL